MRPPVAIGRAEFVTPGSSCPGGAARRGVVPNGRLWFWPSSMPLRFPPCDLPPSATPLRAAVRSFLAEQLAARSPAQRARSWMGFDAGFSRALGARGWIGMTWPAQYGGHEQSAFERYVVLEELLAAGAPVAAHWIADRQSGPMLLRYGNEAQRQAIVPRIARGECFFCIGMSEPDSGSDLASVRARAVRDGDGWRLHGTKVWTSGAERCHYMIALLRTDPDLTKKHAGLSQFVVDLSLPGIEIRPIRNLAGEDHFNEVVFTDAYVDGGALIGAEGQGWKQVTAELGLERSGPERYLSSIQLVLQLVRQLAGRTDDRSVVAAGRLMAHMTTLRHMSLSCAGMLERGENSVTEAALVKDLGVTFEQELPGIAQTLVEAEPLIDGGSDYQQVLAYITQLAPSFSLRGGTREILRGMIAKGLGLR
jgi:alkylation response protein AidB-like acyl-CoA dehydrogenase